MVDNRNNKSKHFGSLNIDNVSVRSRRTDELLLGCERKKTWGVFLREKKVVTKEKRNYMGMKKEKAKTLFWAKVRIVVG